MDNEGCTAYGCLGIIFFMVFYFFVNTIYPEINSPNADDARTMSTLAVSAVISIILSVLIGWGILSVLGYSPAQNRITAEMAKRHQEYAALSEAEKEQRRKNIEVQEIKRKILQEEAERKQDAEGKEERERKRELYEKVKRDMLDSGEIDPI